MYYFINLVLFLFIKTITGLKLKLYVVVSTLNYLLLSSIIKYENSEYV